MKMRYVSKHLLTRVLAILLVLTISIPLMAIPAYATSASFTSSTYDGTLYSSGTNYNTVNASTTGTASGSSYLTIGQHSLSGTYYIYRSYLYFDTSAIPDNAVISSAYINLYGYQVNNDYDFRVYVIPSTTASPHMPLVSADFNKALYTDSVAAGLWSSQISVNAYNTFFLNDVTAISKKGYTKYLLCSDQDYYAIAPDDGYSENLIMFGGKNSINKPQLIVTYSIPSSEPAVTTGGMGNVTETTAVMQGTLDEDGGIPCSVRFEYGTTTGYGNVTNWQSGKNEGAVFSDMVTGLSRGTVYHYRAVASNDYGTPVYGSDATFITKPAAPTNVAIEVGNEENDLSWTKGLGASNTYIYYRTDRYPEITISWDTGNTTETITHDGTRVYIGTGTSFNHPALTNATTYYYVLISYVSSGGHTRYSNTSIAINGMPTAQDVATITTNPATSIGATSATLNGAVTDLGGYDNAMVSFEYYKSGEAEWGRTTTPVLQSTIGTFSDTITELANSSLYYFRAKATNDGGDSYGSTLSFTTGSTQQPPVMTTNAATNVTSTSATLNATVTDDGSLMVSYYFQWGTTVAYGSQSTTGSGYETGDSIYLNIDGLSPATTYHYRIVGSNSQGTSYGADVTFTTLGIGAPSVQTKDASNIGAESVTLNGLLVNTGGAKSEVRFAWGTTADCTTYTGWQPDKNTNDTFKAVIGNLVIGQTYYFKAQVRNDGVTIFNGEVKTFKTVFGAPVGFEAVSISSNTINLTWTKAGDQTYIVVKPTGYPASRADGEIIYSGTGNSYPYMGLEPGRTYYFRAWSWASGGVFSSSYSDALATTKSQSVGEQDRADIIAPPEKPLSWIYSPDYTTQANNPFYSSLNAFADESGIPRNAVWFVSALMLSLIVGLIAYVITKSAMVALVSMLIMQIIFAFMELMPLAWFAIYLIGGMAWLRLAHRGGD